MTSLDASQSTFSPSGSACPACAGVPAAEALARDSVRADHVISLPGVHCAACISTVEKGLMAVPGVTEARVNLTRKRATVQARPEVTIDSLTEALNKLGYEAYELDASQMTPAGVDRAARDLLMRMGVAGFGMMNVMLLSVAVWSGAEDATRDMFHWLSAMISLPVIAFSAQPFFLNAFNALRVGRLNMDVPISLAILLAAGMSLYETIHSGQHAYFDAAVSLTFFLLAGRYLDYRTRAAARSAAQELAALEVPRARKLVDGREVVVSVAELVPGDLIRVVPGARMPADGIVREGRSEVDCSALTGETLPKRAFVGTDIAAGEVNLTGLLTVEVTAAGADSALHRMSELVAVAENARNKYTSLADRAAGLYAPGVHILALAAAIGWWLWTYDLRVALNIASAVLIITCPCALGLAVPAVVTAASGRLFRKGLLIKNGTALERLAEVDTVIFDKTGTLTMGKPKLEGLADHRPGDLALAMAIGAGSAHPLSRALVDAAEKAGIAPAQVDGLTEHPGDGVSAKWHGAHVRMGRADWVGGQPVATALSGQSAVYLRVGDAAPVVFHFTDTLRPGAVEAVAALRAQGLHVEVLSGDVPAAVLATAAELGIDVARGDCRPTDKAARIAELQAQGRRVLMVGDGLNDTVALTTADVSISPASALDAARVASDIVLLGASLAPLADTLTTSRLATKRIRENFTLSTLYNVIAVPLAIAGLATPLIAALAMSLSSITVSLNAMRLR